MSTKQFGRYGGEKEMQGSETNGLASYQQTVNQTPGFASSIWVESTSAKPPVLVQVIPTELEKKDKEPFKQETA